MVMLIVVGSAIGDNAELSCLSYYELASVGNNDDDRIIHERVR
jgi:hypothetical protein